MNKDKKLALSKAEGLIPDLRFPEFVNEGEWEEKELKNVSEVIMGSSPSSSSYNENKIGLPLLQGNADIKNRLSSPRIFTTEVTKECEIDDILLSVRAPVGTVAKSLHKACIGRGISAIRAKNQNSQEYLYQWLFSYESSWQNISQGGTFDAVNSDDIRNLLLPIPKSKEQQKIATCLSSLDEVIAANSQKLDLLKDHKKGLMQNLFPQEGKKVPKFRFPEFRNDGEWKENNIESLFKFKQGIQVPVENQFLIKGSGMVRFIRIIDITNPSEPHRFIDNPGESHIIGENDLFMIRYGSPGIISIGLNGVIANNLFRVIWNSNDFFVSKFWFFAFQSIEKVIYNLSSSSSMPAISFTTLESILVQYPENPKEQQKIASCLSSLDALIIAQAEKIEQLKLHKKGLMQGLFPKIES